MSRTAMQQALDALTKCKAFSDYDPAVIYSDMIGDLVSAIEALKAELAKPDPEPVATVKTINGVWIGYLEKRLPDGTPLYLGAPIVDKDTASW